MYTSITDDEADTIKRAANLIGAGYSETTTAILKALMLEMANRHGRTGTGARQVWIRTLRALGEACVSQARMLDRPETR